MPRGKRETIGRGFFCETCGKPLAETANDHLRQSEFKTHVVIEERREVIRWTNDPGAITKRP